MKTLSTITIGGKIFFSCAFFLLFSCDSTRSLSVNGKQMVSYPLSDNEIRITAGKFGSDYHLFISSDKPFTIQPDSFRYELSTNVTTERIEHFVSQRKYKGNMLYQCGVVLRKCWSKSLPMDSVILKIIPNDFILYQGNRVITDTIFIK